MGKMGVLAKHGIHTTTEPNSGHRNTSDKTTTSIAPVCGMTPINILPEMGGGVGWICSLLFTD